MSLVTNIDNISFENCIYNASGCWCTSKNELNDLVKSNSGALICKSSTMEFRKGNPEPRLYLNNKYGSINSMGVPNLGYKFYLNYGLGVVNKPYIMSIIPFCLNDLEKMLNDINKGVNFKRVIEINLSCPNLIKKTIVGYDYESFTNYLDLINKVSTDNLVLGIKLPPYNVGQTEIICSIIDKYDKIKFITCINSLVDGLILDGDETAIHPKNGYGGIGGLYCKPIALANVNRFYRKLGHKITIIGCGGIKSGQDAYEHILCGASLVQIGTQLMKEGPGCFSRISNELKNIMKKKGYNKISDFRGKLKVKVSQ